MTEQRVKQTVANPNNATNSTKVVKRKGKRSQKEFTPTPMPGTTPTGGLILLSESGINEMGKRQRHLDTAERVVYVRLGCNDSGAVADCGTPVPVLLY